MIKISVSGGFKQEQSAVIEVPLGMGARFVANLLVQLATEWERVVVIEVPNFQVFE